MKRAGFTMIELIFVIVILGILAAVALPRFIGVSEQAEASRCDAFVGTLNRTVLPALWSNMVLNDLNETTAFETDDLSSQIETPDGCGDIADYATAVSAGTPFTIEIGGEDYNVSRIIAPTNTEAPRLGWGKTNP